MELIQVVHGEEDLAATNEKQAETRWAMRDAGCGMRDGLGRGSAVLFHAPFSNFTL